MGRVYRAHHCQLEHTTFAVKLLRGEFAATADMRHRFLHEATTLRRLDHPNIVSVVDVGQTCGLLYMVMEYAPGISLAELIAHGPLPAARAVAIARQMCLGLEHMHDHGVIHRDFKPDNIVVAACDDGDIVRIVDFGLAITDDPSAARVTREGIAVGTPSYIAPEQARGLPLDGRADLFALGMSLYEMLAGILPFSGPPLEVVRLNATEDPPAIADRAGVDVPPELEAIVRTLLAHTPEQRFASAREVIEALDALGDLAPEQPRDLSIVSGTIAIELDREPEAIEVVIELVADDAPAEDTGRISLLPLYPPQRVEVRRRRRGPRVALGVALLGAAAVIGVMAAGHGLGNESAAAAAAAPPAARVAPVAMPAPMPTPAPTPTPQPATTDPTPAPVTPAPVMPASVTPAPVTPAYVTPAPMPTPQPAPTRAAARAVHANPPGRELITETAPAPIAPAPAAAQPAPRAAEIVDPFTDSSPPAAPAPSPDPATGTATAPS